MASRRRGTKRSDSDKEQSDPRCKKNQSQKQDKQLQPIWELTESLLFHIVSFVAPPTHRAAVFCHQIAPLCKASHQKLLQQNEMLWNIVLKEDYGVRDETPTKKSSSKRRRTCERLRRSPVHRVRDAHKLIKDNTEIAYFYLTEMTTSRKDHLTKGKLCRLLEEYGPHLRLNILVSSGGSYLVEVCRARHVTERTILACVRELMEHRGALPDISTNESSSNSAQLTPLCVAAVRAMPNVVKYLLSKGASLSIQCSGRFRLFTKQKRTLSCRNATPLDFAQAMLKAEVEVGASQEVLKDLKACIRILEKAKSSA